MEETVSTVYRRPPAKPLKRFLKTAWP